MNDDLDARLQWILAIALLSIIIGGTADLAMDKPQTWLSFHVVFETLTDYGQHYAIAQRYLPDIVTKGDARVLLVDGEPVPYALARIPTETDNRGDLAAGARGEGRPLSERDRWLARQIGPAMRERGMMFVGLDVIGDYVTEINVTSPTGARELEKQFKIDVGGMLMDAIDRRLKRSGKR